MRKGIDSDLFLQVKKQRWILEGEQILLAFSGGADSMYLLYFLKELQKHISFSLKAMHIQHGIRGKEAEVDRIFSEEQARLFGIPFLSYSCSVPDYAEKEGLGIEEAARILRYRALEREALRWQKESGKKTKIALAHHRDDQAETILYHLLRGAGFSGLAGMRAEMPICSGCFWDMQEASEAGSLEEEVSKDSEVSQDSKDSKDSKISKDSKERILLLRPLLSLRKKEIQERLKDLSIPYREDSTNQDLSYARNYLRLKVLPELEKVNSAAAKHLVEEGELLSEVEEYFQEKAEEWLEKNGKYGSREEAGEIHVLPIPHLGKRIPGLSLFLSLPIPELKKERPLFRREIYKEAIRQLKGNTVQFGRAHYYAIDQLLKRGNGGRISLPEGMVAKVEKKCLLLEKDKYYGKSRKD